MTLERIRSNGAPYIRHSDEHVQLDPGEGGFYLSNAGAERIFIPNGEVGSLLEKLRGVLHSRQLLELIEPDRWNVSGTIIYDSDDGEELLADIALTVEAVDEREALRVALEQLRHSYAGADWESSPRIQRM